MGAMDEVRQTASAIERAVAAERARCANIALAIDSGRGNEKEIAKAIVLGMPASSLPSEEQTK